MKIIASIVALNLAVAFATPVVAAEIPTTKTECEQAGMRWKDCRSINARKLPSPIRIVLGIIGLGLNSSRSHNSVPGMAQRQRS